MGVDQESHRADPAAAFPSWIRGDADERFALVEKRGTGPIAQPRGAKAMIAMPASVTVTPMMFHRSGETPSTSRSHSSATAT